MSGPRGACLRAWLFGTTDDISVDLTRDGLVRTIRLRYFGAKDQATLEARLRSWYTEPGVQPLGITGAYLMDMNLFSLTHLPPQERQFHRRIPHIPAEGSPPRMPRARIVVQDHRQPRRARPLQPRGHLPGL